MIIDVIIMDDSALTRLAIEEIVREMHENKEREMQPPQERKVNPLGKPNTRFLNRTLNSVITHNKRENERTQASCRRKLKELDDRRRKRLRKKEFRRRHSTESNKGRKRRDRSESSHEIYSSTTSEDNSPARSKKSKHKKKRSRTKSNSENEGRGSQEGVENSAYVENYNNIEENFCLTSDNVTNLAYNLAAYNQMNQFLHFEAMLQAGVEAVTSINTETTVVKYEKKIENTTISTSSSTASSISSISSSSSIEGDENGILTINLSSDEHSTGSNKNCNGKRKQSNCSESSVLHFDLNTSSSSRSSPILKSNRKTYNSSSNVSVLICSSDSDTEVANESSPDIPAVLTCSSDKDTEAANKSLLVEPAVPEKPEIMVDLTDD